MLIRLPVPVSTVTSMNDLGMLCIMFRYKLISFLLLMTVFELTGIPQPFVVFF